MTVRANNDPRFYRRFWLIGIGAFAFALYCLYDGLIAYPRQAEWAERYAQLEAEDRLEDWPRVARENGWPTDKPKNEVDIIEQYIMAGVCGAAGAWMFLIVWMSRGRWIESSDEGLSSSWGQSLSYDQIVSLDKRKWREKGIAAIKYQDGKRRRRFVLDNYKFALDETNAILRQVESHLSPDQITGGLPEELGEEQFADADGGDAATASSSAEKEH